MERFSEVVRSKKTEFLRAIQTNIAGDDIVPQVVLGYLEIVGEMDRALGNSKSAWLSSAHCIVALECAAENLAKGNVKKGSKYLRDVDRIWGRRFEKMKNCEESEGIVVDELRKLRDDLELSVNDSTKCAKLGKLSIRDKALGLVRIYLKEEGLVEEEVKDDQDAKLTNDQLVPSSDVIIGSEKPTDENREKGVPLTQPELSEHKSIIVAIDEMVDRVDGSPEMTTNLGRKNCSPKPKIEVDDSPKTKIRRKYKKWSLLEEEILREAVPKFGKAWTAILNSHREEFEERTDVDLKDKWRNMTKYSN